MRVFISSLIRGLEDERDAAATGIETLRHVPRRAEDFGASPDSPQIVCLAGVRECELTTLILGATYGAIQPSGLSATEEEYREAKELHRPVLAFVQAGIDPEPRQAAFMADVRQWVGGQFSGTFESPTMLTQQVTRALHEFELAQASGPVDVDEMRGRAVAALPTPGPFHMPTPRIAMAVAGGPRRSILRPEEIEDEALARRLQQEAMFGPAAVLDPGGATQVRHSGHSLSIDQADGALRVDEEGTIVIEQPAWDPHARAFMPALIHEEVMERLERALQLAGSVLEQLDPLHRLSDIVPAATIIGTSYGAWRTRAEQERSPQQMEVNVHGRERPVVTLATPRLHRAALSSQGPQLARDFTVLLRRAMTERT